MRARCQAVERGPDRSLSRPVALAASTAQAQIA